MDACHNTPRVTFVEETPSALRPLMRFISAALVITPLMASAGSWQTLKNPPPLPDIFDPQGHFAYSGGAAFPLLMTDGGVMVQNVGDGKIFKLTPDSKGSYVNGTWFELATMPYVAYAGAQAVLADGRVIMEGGEYSDWDFNFLLTNKGAIYDPVTNKWTSVPPPKFFVDLYPPRALFAPHPIGDSQSVVLEDGTFMLADKMSRQAALLNAKTLTWTETGTSSKFDLNDEEGWTLLPSGKVLTVDCYTDFYFGLVPSYPKNPTNSEIYDPETGQWSSAGSTINTLTDPALSEFGPAVLRPNGTVFAVGSQGYTSIYHTRSGKWSAGPRLPLSPQGFQYTAQDAPGALLPNGNVLFAVSGGAEPPGGFSNPPVAFFEFNGHRFIPEPTIPNAPFDVSGSLNLLVLPTGQILAADGTTDIEIYTPDERDRDHEQEQEQGDDQEQDRDWAPEIFWGPRVVHRGASYQLSGIRFNGMSQASMFGDEGQSATNYPLVRITNLSTHHVFYSRTHDHSSMAVASDDIVSTHFDVSPHQESGLSKLEVVANGIASEPLMVLVK